MIPPWKTIERLDPERRGRPGSYTFESHVNHGTSFDGASPFRYPPGGMHLTQIAKEMGGLDIVACAPDLFLAKPIERMTEHARTITAERLSDRLPVDNAEDEMGRLAAVFNETLGRLEESFEQMRRFTADVSHQLRTPLTALRLRLENLQVHAADADLGRPLAAAVPLAYQLISIASLAWFARTGDFNLLRICQLAPMLVLPFVLQWTLGGFENSSAVMVWAFAGPMSALVFYGPRHAALFMAAFLGLTVACARCHDHKFDPITRMEALIRREHVLDRWTAAITARAGHGT